MKRNRPFLDQPAGWTATPRTLETPARYANPFEHVRYVSRRSVVWSYVIIATAFVAFFAFALLT